MAKTVMGSRKQPRIKRGSQSYHTVTAIKEKDYTPGGTETRQREKAAKAEAQIEREN